MMTRSGCRLMIKWVTAITLAVLFLLSAPALFRKCTVPLVSNKKVVAVGKRPFVMPWKDNKFGVFAGDTNLFTLWGDAFDFPLFIYPFTDNQRFLCVYDYDVSILVFVVDLGSIAAGTSNAQAWPAHSYLREVLAQGATNVVLQTQGSVRLPSFAEAQEVSSNLTTLPISQLEARSFPFLDLGVYRSYWPKDRLIAALHPNRESCWP
jgi:hypothetical protein